MIEYFNTSNQIPTPCQLSLPLCFRAFVLTVRCNKKSIGNHYEQMELKELSQITEIKSSQKKSDR